MSRPAGSTRPVRVNPPTRPRTTRAASTPAIGPPESGVATARTLPLPFPGPVRSAKTH
jgi:hypothetical protein